MIGNAKVFDAPQAEETTRRGFFRRLFVQEASKSLDWHRTAPRPPSCVSDDLLPRLCNGCGQCEENCPQHIIRLVNGKPALSLEYNHCTDCLACRDTCPTLALSGDRMFTGMQPKFSALCHSRCQSGCNDCQTVCPNQAIDIEHGQPVLQTAKCTGCGQCQHECPINAIHLELVLG